ncbi:unnamed protein product [Schistocephalus solidus]|uniref:Uncharacterized protein n=1 Tax=Schistocephalus solidus TaxID=70667 RepID=A0A3P7C9T8_SCHSO|nr:unnamed protein product [Schistocephalus solidus]
MIAPHDILIKMAALFVEGKNDSQSLYFAYLYGCKIVLS